MLALGNTQKSKFQRSARTPSTAAADEGHLPAPLEPGSPLCLPVPRQEALRGPQVPPVCSAGPSTPAPSADPLQRWLGGHSKEPGLYSHIPEEGSGGNPGEV